MDERTGSEIREQITHDAPIVTTLVEHMKRVAATVDAKWSYTITHMANMLEKGIQQELRNFPE